MPALRHLKVFNTPGLGAVGDAAQHRLSDRLDSLEQQACHFNERLAVRKARQAARA